MTVMTRWPTRKVSRANPNPDRRSTDLIIVMYLDPYRGRSTDLDLSSKLQDALLCAASLLLS